jgi:hypothetical protein
MGLRQKQSDFAHAIAVLIFHIHSKGYETTKGDAYDTEGSECPHCGGKVPGRHKRNSFHYKRLAEDINLFKDDVYLTSTEDHREFGEFWKSLDPMATWGGDFKRKDGNHYSWGEN